MKKGKDKLGVEVSTLAEIRREYQRSGLRWENFPEEPLSVCKQWIREAVDQKLPDPNAMQLATVSSEDRPNVRTVLLKDISEKGFTFYTSYESKKGKEIASNPQVALLFFWAVLERQLRVQGKVKKLSTEVSDTYFSIRSRSSQISAWASNQSSVLSNKALLLSRKKKYELQFMKMEKVPRPPTWGGYLVQPESIEFWQGRSNRLHDRIFYEKQSQGHWKKQWLSP